MPPTIPFPPSKTSSVPRSTTRSPATADPIPSTAALANDTLNGLGGNDTLNGGLGADRLDGGSGDDQIVADSADTTAPEPLILGGDGADFLTLSAEGESGSATFSSNATTTGQFETIYGTPGDDIIDHSGESTPVIVYGLGGDDTIIGGNGDDQLHGDQGNDTLIGGPGNDALFGGDGNDQLLSDAGAGSVLI